MLGIMKKASEVVDMTWNQEQALAIWAQDYGEKEVAYDYLSRPMHREDYNNGDSPYGWTIDLVRPLAMGGSYQAENLLPCSLYAYRERGGRTSFSVGHLRIEMRKGKRYGTSMLVDVTDALRPFSLLPEDLTQDPTFHQSRRSLALGHEEKESFKEPPTIDFSRIAFAGFQSSDEQKKEEEAQKEVDAALKELVGTKEDKASAEEEKKEEPASASEAVSSLEEEKLEEESVPASHLSSTAEEAPTETPSSEEAKAPEETTGKEAALEEPAPSTEPDSVPTPAPSEEAKKPEESVSSDEEPSAPAEEKEEDEALRSRLRALEVALENVEKEKDDLTSKLQASLREKEEESQAKTALEETKKENEARIEALKKSAEEYQAKQALVEKSLTAAETSLDESQASLASARKESEALKASLAEKEEALSKAEEEGRQLRTSVEEKDGELSGKEAALQAGAEERKKLSAELSEAKAELENLKALVEKQNQSLAEKEELVAFKEEALQQIAALKDQEAKYQSSLTESEKKASALVTASAETSENLRLLREEKEKESQLLQAREEALQNQNQAVETLQGQLMALNQSKEEDQKTITALKETVSLREASLKTLSEEKESLSQEKNRLSQEKENLLKEKESLGQEKEKLSSEMAAKEGEVRALSERLKESQEKAEETALKSQEHEEKIRQSELALSASSSSLAQAQEEIENRKKERDELSQALASEKEKSQALQAEKETLNASLSSAEEKLKEKEAALLSALNEAQKEKQEKEGMEQSLSEGKAREAALEETVLQSKKEAEESKEALERKEKETLLLRLGLDTTRRTDIEDSLAQNGLSFSEEDLTRLLPLHPEWKGPSTFPLYDLPAIEKDSQIPSGLKPSVLELRTKQVASFELEEKQKAEDRALFEERYGVESNVASDFAGRTMRKSDVGNSDSLNGFGETLLDPSAPRTKENVLLANYATLKEFRPEGPFVANGHPFQVRTVDGVPQLTSPDVLTNPFRFDVSMRQLKESASHSFPLIYLYVRFLGLAGARPSEDDLRLFADFVERSAGQVCPNALLNLETGRERLFLSFDGTKENVYDQTMQYAILLNSYRKVFKNQGRFDAVLVLDETEIPYGFRHMGFDDLNQVLRDDLELKAIKYDVDRVGVVDSTIGRCIQVGPRIWAHYPQGKYHSHPSALGQGNFASAYGFKEQFVECRFVYPIVPEFQK